MRNLRLKILRRNDTSLHFWNRTDSISGSISYTIEHAHLMADFSCFTFHFEPSLYLRDRWLFGHIEMIDPSSSRKFTSFIVYNSFSSFNLQYGFPSPVIVLYKAVTLFRREKYGNQHKWDWGLTMVNEIR